MDKLALKRFAFQARRILREELVQKACEVGVTSKEIKCIEKATSGPIDTRGVIHKKPIKNQRESLVKRVKQNGFDQVIDEASYTWFNWFITLRFMEVNDYLETGIRVFSSVNAEKKDPDLLTHALSIDLPVNQDYIYQLQEERAIEELYKYLIITQCNKLNTCLPTVFARIEDFTELLFPGNLLQEGSIIFELINAIDEEDWRHVETVGWLYQYYISEKKDEVFAQLKKKKKIEKGQIPAATQLFTPKWIVKYMVENSLGSLWLEHDPQSSIKQELNYYIKSKNHQDLDCVVEQNKRKQRQIKLEEIKLIDPACGSGHILVEAFDLLYKLYEEQGYVKSEIPILILEHNLYGLDIDDRAAQLAVFALAMKARQYSEQAFDQVPSINVLAIQESNHLPKERLISHISQTPEQANQLRVLFDLFTDAKNIGSLITTPLTNYSVLKKRIAELKRQGSTNHCKKEVTDYFDDVNHLLKQAEILSDHYDVVITNPPYMGYRGMNHSLSHYIKMHFPDSKADLFAVFMDRTNQFTKGNGYTATINQHSWMFLSSFKALREKILHHLTLQSMLHLGTKAFEEIGGEVVQSTCFVTKKQQFSNGIATFYRLTDFPSSNEKEEAFLKGEAPVYAVNQKAFLEIPGSPVAYWVSEKIRTVFKENPQLDHYVDLTGSQHITANNEKYLRYFWEVSQEELFNRWISYAKGGKYRKWYGNTEIVLDWSKEAQCFYKQNTTSNKIKKSYMFRRGITWSATTSSDFSCRQLCEKGAFDKKGPSLFVIDEAYFHYFMGFLNSRIVNQLLRLLSASLDFQNIDIKRLPVAIPTIEQKEQATEHVKQCINIAKREWDSFETSWDFNSHPIIQYKGSSSRIEEAFEHWATFMERQFSQLKHIEQKLNQLFLDIYQMNDEWNSELEDKLITHRKADVKRDIRSFISYAVGCIMGRYSLDHEGIVFAGGTFQPENYKTIQADQDGITPIDKRFNDDLVRQIEEFIKVTFDEKNLAENLDFISKALGKKSYENPIERIRKYMLSDFYKDHLKAYHKRPIYWQFTSGKHKAFQALVYLHRIDRLTISKIRTVYLHKVQYNYELESEYLKKQLTERLSLAEKRKVISRLAMLAKYKEELMEYDEKLRSFSESEQRINLNDGVAVNYNKFKSLLTPIR